MHQDLLPSSLSSTWRPDQRYPEHRRLQRLTLADPSRTRSDRHSPFEPGGRPFSEGQTRSAGTWTSPSPCGPPNDTMERSAPSQDRAEAPENHTPGIRGVGPGCDHGDWAPTRLDFRRAWGSSSSWPVASYGQTPGGPIPTPPMLVERARSRWRRLATACSTTPSRC